MAFLGRPSCFPFERACRKPARTLSTIRLRSSSATAPRTVKIILPVGVLVVDLFRERNELNAQRIEGLQRPQQMRNRSSKTVKPLHNDDIESAFVSILHHPVQLGSRVFLAGRAVAHVSVMNLPAPGAHSIPVALGSAWWDLGRRSVWRLERRLLA